MTLKEYIKGLQEVIVDNPEAADFIVIYASDEEGNSHHPVYCNGTIVQVEDPKAHYVEIYYNEEGDTNGEVEYKPNAVIIN